MIYRNTICQNVTDEWNRSKEKSGFDGNIRLPEPLLLVLLIFLIVWRTRKYSWHLIASSILGSTYFHISFNHVDMKRDTKKSRAFLEYKTLWMLSSINFISFVKQNKKPPTGYGEPGTELHFNIQVLLRVRTFTSTKIRWFKYYAQSFNPSSENLAWNLHGSRAGLVRFSRDRSCEFLWDATRDPWQITQDVNLDLIQRPFNHAGCDTISTVWMSMLHASFHVHTVYGSRNFLTTNPNIYFRPKISYSFSHSSTSTLSSPKRSTFSFISGIISRLIKPVVIHVLEHVPFFFSTQRETTNMHCFDPDFPTSSDQVIKSTSHL